MRAERPDVPSEVAEVVQRLLQKSPEARFRSALEVLSALAEATGDAKLRDEVAGRGHRGRARLVGRESLLHLVEGALGWGTQTIPDRGALVCIRGAAGVGKSRIVGEVAVRARLRGFEVIELDAMSAAQQRVGLARLLGVERPHAGGRAGITGFDAQLGDALVDRARRRPIAITVDASRHDPAQIQVWLRTLSRASSVAPLWVVAEFAAGEPPSEGLSIDISAIPVSRTAALLEATLGPMDAAAEVAEVLHERSAGNPAALDRDLRALVRDEVLRCRNGRWFANPAQVRAAPLPAADREAASHLVEQLRPEEVHTLAAVAVLGERASVANIARISGAAAGAMLAKLVADGIVLRCGATHSLSPAVDAAAAEVAGASTIEALHAEVLRLDLVHDPVDRLAHARGAGRHAQVVGLALEAARTASERLDFATAARCLQDAAQARREVDDPGLTTEAELLAHLGDTHIRAGDPAAAANSLREAIACSDGLVHRLQLALGRALAAAGNHEAALDAFQGADCCTKSSHCLELAFAHGWSLTMLGRYDQARAVASEALCSPIAAEDPAGAAQLLYLRGTIAWHAGDYQQASDILTDTVAEAEQRGDKLLMGDALKGLGTALRYCGELEAAALAYRRASAVFEQLGLLAEVAKATNNEGVTAYMRGRWAEAQHKWEEFADIVDRLGHSTERVHALNNLGVLYKDRGELEKAVRTFETGRALAQQLGYTRFEAMLHGNLADAQIRRKQFSEARSALDTCERLAREVGAQGELVEAARRRAELLLAEGKHRQALSCARAALSPSGGADGSEDALLRRVCGLALLALGDVAHASRAILEAKSIFEEQGAKYELAQTLICDARVQRVKRDPRGAIKRLDQAIQILEPLGARLDLEEARDELRAARQDIQSAGGAAARLRLVLECAREIARIRQLEPLLHALVDAALDVTNHERGFVVLYDATGVATVEVGHNFDRREFDSDTAAPSHSIADRVRASGEPVGSTDLSHDERFMSQQSIVLAGIRAARCVPITTPDGVLGVLYTDSPFAGTTNDTIQDDLEVLQALADHAAVAIENVRLLEERDDRYTLIARTAHEINRPLTPLLYAWDSFLSGYSSPGVLYFNTGTGLASSSLILDLTFWNPALFSGTPGVQDSYEGIGTGLASSSFVFDYNLSTLDWLGFETGGWDLLGTGLASSSLVLDDGYLNAVALGDLSQWYAFGRDDQTVGAGDHWVPLR